MTDWLDELLLSFEADATRLDVMAAQLEDRPGKWVVEAGASSVRDIIQRIRDEKAKHDS